MKIYCNLKLKGISTEEDFNDNFSGTNRILNLDDIHFMVPKLNVNVDDFVDVHLDFNEIDGHFSGNEYIVRFKGLADTWNELNFEESNIEKEDITIELLESGYIENYVLFFNKDNGERFTDIEITKIGYIDEFNNEKDFHISNYAINEA